VYFDKILLNASQVTNPSIDPLREPMETKVFLAANRGVYKEMKTESLLTICPAVLNFPYPLCSRP